MKFGLHYTIDVYVWKTCVCVCVRISTNATQCDILSAQGYKSELNYVCVVTVGHVLWLSRCGGNASQSHAVI